MSQPGNESSRQISTLSFSCSVLKRKRRGCFRAKPPPSAPDFFPQTLLANNGAGGRSRQSPLAFLLEAAGTLALPARGSPAAGGCTRRGPSWGRRQRRRRARRRGWTRPRATCSWGPTGPSTSKSATSSTPTSGEHALPPTPRLLVVPAWLPVWGILVRCGKVVASDNRLYWCGTRSLRCVLAKFATNTT